jgi:hypothetical protein
MSCMSGVNLFQSSFEHIRIIHILTFARAWQLVDETWGSISILSTPTASTFTGLSPSTYVTMKILVKCAPVM